MNPDGRSSVAKNYIDSLASEVIAPTNTWA
jgi:hypothetical protein